jgi:Domain of unknown function (DUF4265)
MSTTKIEFPLQVEDGYPPISFESLNARPVEDGRFEILNTPFFSENVAYGDVVIALRHQDGRLVFDAVVTFSGFRSISIILFDDSLDAHLLDILRGLQCVIEYGEFGALRMVAVGIPEAVDYDPIRASLDEYERLGKLSYAELVA